MMKLNTRMIAMALGAFAALSPANLVAQAIDPALLLGANPAAVSALQEELRRRDNVAADPALPVAQAPAAARAPVLLPDPPKPAEPEKGGVVQSYFRALTGQMLPVQGRELFRLELERGAFLFNAVGRDYRVAPGDQLRVVIRGIQSDDMTLQLDRDGTLTVGDLLPLSVSGLTIAELREDLSEALRINDPSVEVAVSLSSARLVPVQFTGFVAAPQTLAIPAYTPLSAALSQVGGIAPDGSLRSVSVIAPGAPVQRVDLYGLVNGEAGFDDVLLTERTRVHVDGIGATVAVTGFAPSAAIFELPRNVTSISVADLLAQASVGVLPSGATLEVISLNADGRPASRRLETIEGERVAAGEALNIAFRGLRDLDRIEVSGAVLNPQKLAYVAGMRLSDVLKGGAALTPEADADIALIRNTSPERKPRVVSLRRAFSEPDSVVVEPGDIVHVFNRSELAAAMNNLALSDMPSGDVILDSLRAAEPALVQLDDRAVALLPAGSKPEDSLRLSAILRTADLYTLYGNRVIRDEAINSRQISAFNPSVEWFGEAPRPMRAGEKVQLFTLDFVRGFGERFSDVDQQAASDAEDVQQVAQALSPRILADALFVNDLQRVTGAVQFPGAYPFTGAVTLADVLGAAGGTLTSANLTGVTLRQLAVRGDVLILASERKLDMTRVDPKMIRVQGRFDLFVPDLVNDAFIGTITLSGEVRRPGEYAISRGETLGDVIRRAGGMTSTAYPLGAVFTRQQNAETERASYRRLSDQIRQLVLGLSQAERDGAADQIAAVISFANQIEAAPVTGRQVVTLGAEGSAERIELAAGDRLIIPTRPSFVRVIGAVSSEVSTQYIEGRPATAYLADAGGPTKLADLPRSFLVLPNGQSLPLDLRASKSAPVPPGSVIVVPPRLDRLSPLALSEIIAGVLGNIATSILAFDTISSR